MKNIVISFIDAHGVSHTGAVFELTYGNKNVSRSETIGQSEGTYNSISVNYQFQYWYSQAAKDEGLQPSFLMDKAGQQTFGAYPTTEAEIVSLEDYCIAHLISQVLPAIDPNAAVVV